MELETLVSQGRELIDQTTSAHTQRWGLGTEQRWILDQSDGRIRWSFADHVASAPAQILGSWNSKVGSFAWSWDNDSIAESLCATAEEVRAFGVENEMTALHTSPMNLDEERVRDLVALAFRLGGCTGLFHPYNGQLASYIAFGPVTLEESGGRISTFEVPQQ